MLFQETSPTSGFTSAGIIAGSLTSKWTGTASARRLSVVRKGGGRLMEAAIAAVLLCGGGRFSYV